MVEVEGEGDGEGEGEGEGEGACECECVDEVGLMSRSCLGRVRCKVVATQRALGFPTTPLNPSGACQIDPGPDQGPASQEGPPKEAMGIARCGWPPKHARVHSTISTSTSTPQPHAHTALSHTPQTHTSLSVQHEPLARSEGSMRATSTRRNDAHTAKRITREQLWLMRRLKSPGSHIASHWDATERACARACVRV